MKELRTQANPNIVIALVGNKTDMQEVREVKSEVGNDFAVSESLLFFEASAKAGHGVREVFTAVGS